MNEREKLIWSNFLERLSYLRTQCDSMRVTHQGVLQDGLTVAIIPFLGEEPQIWLWLDVIVDGSKVNMAADLWPLGFRG